MKNSIRILLIDDHQVVRDGLQHMLQQEEDMEVVGQGASSQEALAQAIKAGAVGYLLKDVKREELVRAIRTVHEGRSPLGISFSRDRLAELAGLGEGKGHFYLSERELSILRLIADGVTTKEIANKVFLSEASVKRSVHVIFDKLGVRNRSEAVSEAYKRRLI